MDLKRSWESCAYCGHTRTAHGNHGRGPCGRLITCERNDQGDDVVTRPRKCDCAVFTSRKG